MRIWFLLIILIVSCLTYADNDSLYFEQSIDSLMIIYQTLKTDVDNLFEDNQNLFSEIDKVKQNILKLDSISFNNIQVIAEFHNQLEDLRTQLNEEIQIIKDTQMQQNDEINNLINDFNENLLRLQQEANMKIENAEQNTQQIASNLSGKIQQKQLIFIIISIVLLLISFLIYFFIKLKLFKQGSSLISRIAATRKTLEEDTIKLDNKLIELLDRQISAPSQEKDTDHSLALKVADEIIRIEKNLSRMDANIKGHKQLQGSIKRIKDNFASKGYEIVDMVGKKYNEGMKVKANFVPDESLKKDEQIITRIIKPQVNYNGIMVQQAHIEVSQGE